MRLGVDYAWSHPNILGLKAAGATFACRYLSTDPSKNINRAEAKLLRSNGIDVVLVWEAGAGNALGGARQGAADAKDALAQAAACGAPKGQPIYFAVDFDATPAQQRAISAYFRAARQVLGAGRVGGYGGLHVVKRLFDAGLIDFGWQTLAWSGGEWEPRAHIRQVGGARINGVQVDTNQAMKARFGQWSALKPKPAPAPTPKPAPAPKPVPAPKPQTVVITGPKGGKIATRTARAAAKLVPGLVRRFGKITIRKGSR